MAGNSVGSSERPCHVLVTKRDGSIRFSVDYRRVSSMTKKDAYPLPRIDDTLNTLGGAEWFCTMDLAGIGK